MYWWHQSTEQLCPPLGVFLCILRIIIIFIISTGWVICLEKLSDSILMSFQWLPCLMGPPPHKIPSTKWFPQAESVPNIPCLQSSESLVPGEYPPHNLSRSNLAASWMAWKTSCRTRSVCSNFSRTKINSINLISSVSFKPMLHSRNTKPLIPLGSFNSIYPVRNSQDLTVHQDPYHLPRSQLHRRWQRTIYTQL